MIKICEECGKEFDTRQPGQRFCNDDHYRKCVVCGSDFLCKVKDSNARKVTTCSRKCAGVLRMRTISSVVKYCEYCGAEFTSTSNSTKLCSNQHYAVCSICNKSFEISNYQISANQIPKTCSIECQDKSRRATNLATYGTEIAACSDIVKKKLMKPKSSEEKFHVCKICGQRFEYTQNAQMVCSNVHLKKCEICGSDFVVTLDNMHSACCSSKCSEAKRKQTMLKNYGVEYAMQSAEIQQKAKATLEANYGCTNPAQSDIVKAKIQETCQTRYNTSSPLQVKEIREKGNGTNLTKFGHVWAIQSEEIAKKAKLNYTKTCLEKFGVPYACMTPQCIESRANLILSLNRSFASDLESLGLSCKLEKHLADKSFDIEILNQNILIEIDPTYMHSTQGNHWNSNGLSRTYHLEKSQLASDNGYRCIHIFDWDDKSKILDMLKPKQTIYARKCVIKLIDKHTANVFINQHHLQGKCNGTNYAVGLYYNGSLVEIMTFGEPRYTNKYEWELLRLCTDSNYRVIGGASKLMTRFIQDNNPKSLISYCDAAKFSGQTYYQLGMKLDHISEPAKVWSKSKDKVTDNLLRQRGYDQLFKTNYGKGTSNEQLMIEDGWRSVYDCGQYVFTKSFE